MVTGGWVEEEKEKLIDILHIKGIKKYRMENIFCIFLESEYFMTMVIITLSFIS